MANNKIYTTRQMVALIDKRRNLRFKTVNQANQLMAYIESRYNTLIVINKETDAKYEGEHINNMEWVEM